MYNRFTYSVLVALRNRRSLIHTSILNCNQTSTEKQDLQENKYPGLLYSSVIEEKKDGWLIRKLKETRKKREFQPTTLSIAAKYIVDKTEETTTEQQSEDLVTFPYKQSVDFYKDASENETSLFEVKQMSDVKLPKLNKEYVEDELWKMNYGRPAPDIPISSVPCGGCGALLHCQNSAVPGYIPSELFCGLSPKELRLAICQRCYLLKEHNIALKVSVSSADYIEALSCIKERFGLIILIVDLTDIPCSIPPGISDIIGKKRPVVVVGNKLDLIPAAQRNWLSAIQKSIETSLEQQGVASATFLKDVLLISAKTGYGIEQLITTLQKNWNQKGDVYLIGCTNVGKSSLFNALLQSDYCDIKATDIVQRATVSTWPGTTLNLLKFPLLNPKGWHLYQRRHRLKAEEEEEQEEKALRTALKKKNKHSHYASIIGHIGKTFRPQTADDEISFSVMTSDTFSSAANRRVVDEQHPLFRKSYWCYDTPGTINKEQQFLDLLTAEEVMAVLPNTVLDPVSMIIKPQTSLFIGGVARLDFLEGVANRSVTLTVYRPATLPLNMVLMDQADDFYTRYLGTDILSVPRGSLQRLEQWPSLSSTVFHIAGEGRRVSCADIVLSSAGWVSVTADAAAAVVFRAWTPEGRGAALRIPSMLPQAVLSKGKKITGCPLYAAHTMED